MFPPLFFEELLPLQKEKIKIDVAYGYNLCDGCVR